MLSLIVNTFPRLGEFGSQGVSTFLGQASADAPQLTGLREYIAGDDFRLHLRLHRSWFEVFYAREHLHSLFLLSAYIIQVCSDCLCERVMCAKDLLRGLVDIFEYPFALAKVAERGGWVVDCEDRRKSGTYLEREFVLRSKLALDGRGPFAQKNPGFV